MGNMTWVPHVALPQVSCILLHKCWSKFFQLLGLILGLLLAGEHCTKASKARNVSLTRIEANRNPGNALEAALS